MAICVITFGISSNEENRLPLTIVVNLFLRKKINEREKNPNQQNTPPEGSEAVVVFSEKLSVFCSLTLFVLYIHLTQD